MTCRWRNRQVFCWAMWARSCRRFCRRGRSRTQRLAREPRAAVSLGRQLTLQQQRSLAGPVFRSRMSQLAPGVHMYVCICRICYQDRSSSRIHDPPSPRQCCSQTSTKGEGSQRNIVADSQTSYRRSTWCSTKVAFQPLQGGKLKGCELGGIMAAPGEHQLGQDACSPVGPRLVACAACADTRR